VFNAVDAPARYPDPIITPVPHFVGARDAAAPADRLRSVRRAAAAFREQMLESPPVAMFRSFDLVKAPYPTKHGLRDAARSPLPFIHILNRLFVVQWKTPHGLKTLLAEPLDRVGNAQTPFFRRLAKPLGGSEALLPRRVWPPLGDVLELLERLGIAPTDVDYITYDHLHTQDIRRWLGTSDTPAAFPNAKLLVTRQEWASAKAPLPLDAQWYCPDGTRDVSEDKVIFLDHDVTLGDGLALVRTPGHTEGNHSIVVRTPEGIFVTSENGVCADAYAPEHSAIPGLREYARRTGAEVVLNGNTLEGALDQYISMVMEKEIAGASQRNPDFPNVAVSSEMCSHPLSPGLAPTFHVGELSFGAPASSRSATPEEGPTAQ
jgi:hypothetical protein